MSNSYFQFKEFTIFQDQCAMKVCTDACILGAWFACGKQVHGKVLDLGSGSGLLMLMLAQKKTVQIDGIELDEASYAQSVANIAASKWQSFLQVFLGDARSFPFTTRYDFIITNPPFFEDSLPASSSRANTAKHDSGLKFSELIRALDNQLNPSGNFGILLPFNRINDFEKLAFLQGFHLQRSLMVRQTENHAHFRTVRQYGRIALSAPPETQELTIQDSLGEYTPGFRALMKDYYLHL